jgi:putative component of toxin-antitoxin plasmid stabilization module
MRWLPKFPKKKKIAIFARFESNFVGDLHVVSLGVHEFRENGRREDIYFLMGANKIIFIFLWA